MSWHVDEADARRYAERQLDATSVASVEAHLLHCAGCRMTVGGVVEVTAGKDLLDAVWVGVTEQLDRPSLGAVERLLCRLGCSESTARIIAATTRSRWAYLFAVGLSVLLALHASQSPRDAAFGLFLVVAPIGPLVATAVAFGRWSEPVYELLGTVPTSPLRVLLLRVIAAVTPAIALTALSIPWLLERGWLAAAWLLPSLALAVGAIALSSWISVEVAAFALGTAWVAIPLVLRLPVADLFDLFGAPAQIASIVAAALAIGVTVARRHAFEYREV